MTIYMGHPVKVKRNRRYLSTEKTARTHHHTTIQNVNNLHPRQKSGDPRTILTDQGAAHEETFFNDPYKRVNKDADISEIIKFGST